MCSGDDARPRPPRRGGRGGTSPDRGRGRRSDRARDGRRGRHHHARRQQLRRLDGRHGRRRSGRPWGGCPVSPRPSSRAATTVPGLVAEHGFAALVTIRRGDRTHTLLFDTGVSPTGMADNMERLGLDAGDIEAVVLSHGHFDHAGGFPGLARLRRRRACRSRSTRSCGRRRRVVLPVGPTWELPTLRRSSLEAEGFEVDRTPPAVAAARRQRPDHRRGRPHHRLRARHAVPRGRAATAGWEPDPLILDDQALVVHVRGQGPRRASPGAATPAR